MGASRSIRLVAAAALSAAALGLVPATASATTAAVVTPDSISSCTNTTPPGSWFYSDVVAAEKSTTAIPDSWGKSHDIARIACYESSYNPKAVNPNGLYFGLGQLGKPQVAATGVSWTDYWNGTSVHAARYYQIVAMLKYCKTRYGSPSAAWAHEVADGWW